MEAPKAASSWHTTENILLAGGRNLGEAAQICELLRNKKVVEKNAGNYAYSARCLMQVTYVDPIDVDGVFQAAIIPSVGNSGEIGRRGER